MHRLLTTYSLLLAPYSLLLTTGSLLLAPYYWLLTPYSLLLASYYWLLTTGSLLLAPYYWLLTPGSLLLTHVLGEHRGDVSRHPTDVACGQPRALLALRLRLRVQATAHAAAPARGAATAPLKPRQARYLVITPREAPLYLALYIYIYDASTILTTLTLLTLLTMAKALVAGQCRARVDPAHPLREWPPLQAGGAGCEEEEGLGARPCGGGARDGADSPRGAPCVAGRHI
jgi:hypothetical protein